MYLNKRRIVTAVFLAAVGAACIAQAGSQTPAAEHAGKVKRLRVPNGGIQPQVAVDGKGVLHMIYYHGDPRHGDIFYLRSDNGRYATITRDVFRSRKRRRRIIDAPVADHPKHR